MQSSSIKSPFLSALNGESPSRYPVWLMRQAGRYLPEYRQIRAESEMLAVCQDPSLVTEVTLQPLRRFDLDAAILFSDITMPFFCMNMPFSIVPGIGPVVDRPITDLNSVSELRPVKPAERLGCITESIELLKGELKVPLIGFAGAPFTLATYMIEGKPSRTFKLTREMMYRAPETWSKLMGVLVPLTVEYLELQIAAGVDALQLFDSWVGALPLSLYREAVLPHLKEIFTRLSRHNLPMIYFGTGLRHLFPAIKELPIKSIGVDWSVPMRTIPKELGDAWAVQGNLDPVALFADWDRLKLEVDSVIADAAEVKSHVFNLGHGVLPGTPIDNVRRLVDYVHAKS